MASGNHSEHHIVPLSDYIKVFSALIVLTVVTVAAAQVDFGALNTLIAFAIATVKAVLVMAIFMHLKYDDRLNTVIICSSFFFLILLWLFSYADIYTRVFQPSTL